MDFYKAYGRVTWDQTNKCCCIDFYKAYNKLKFFCEVIKSVNRKILAIYTKF